MALFDDVSPSNKLLANVRRLQPKVPMNVPLERQSESPLVSIIMPCYNEEKFIPGAITSLLKDAGPTPTEIIVADALSTDGSAAVVRDFISQGLPIRLIQNPGKYPSRGLNLCLREAKGAFIVRADAHCVYPPNYIQRCLELLRSKDAANAGGVMAPLGRTPLQQGIAEAMRHRIGVGDARFHLGDYTGYVDTVYLGAFRKDLIDEIGMYDQEMRANEDAEFNLRILKAGKKIFLDSSLQTIYFPRTSLRQLAKQYFFYGRGRAYTVWKHKRFTSWRQVGPPLLVLGLCSSLALSFLSAYFLLLPALYILSVLLIALGAKTGGMPLRRSPAETDGFGPIETAKLSPFAIRLAMGMAIVVMHICWGTGFLTKCPRFPFGKRTHRLPASGQT